MPYTHLTAFERYHVELCRQNGSSMHAIARELKRSPSTISREVKRNANSRVRYRALQAQQRYAAARKRSVRVAKIPTSTPLRAYVTTKLRTKWSPEQITHGLRRAFPRDGAMRISHESIYAFVYADKRANGDLYKELRQGHRKRQRRGNAHQKRGLIPGRVSITERPTAVDTRLRSGHWEGDTIHGAHHKGGVVTLVERKTRVLVAAPITDFKASTINQAIQNAFRGIPTQFIRTLTLDNGKEFAGFKQLEELLRARIYFADPYSPWQRGSNENANGLSRQYLPKKTDLRNLDNTYLQTIVQALNNRPRKILNHRTPAERFLKLTRVALHP